jgi:small subunit ribosomal protein S16
VAVKIKLMRLGKIRAPYYRIVVADSRTKRDGRAIEEIGKYHPTREPSLIEVDSERAQYWLSVGAQPTEPVAAILKVTGDWQKFKGEPGAEGTLRTAEPRADKKAIFEAAAKDSAGGSGGAKEGATTPRKRTAKKVAAEAAEGTPAAARPTADEAAAEGDVRAAGSESAADTTASDTTASDTTPADVPPGDTTAADVPAADEPGAGDDSAAKASPGTAQAAPAVEETTSVERSGTDES